MFQIRVQLSFPTVITCLLSNAQAILTICPEWPKPSAATFKVVISQILKIIFSPPVATNLPSLLTARL